MAKLSVNLDQGFKEAIDFFKHKQNIPTNRWNDLQKEMHSRAFVIAGVTKQSMLSDFKGSILKALEKTLTQQLINTAGAIMVAETGELELFIILIYLVHIKQLIIKKL